MLVLTGQSLPSYGGKQYPGTPPLVRGPAGGHRGGHPYDHFSRPSSIRVRRESAAARRVFRLRSYRDGQLFRFDVPTDARMAVWRFGTNRTDSGGGGRERFGSNGGAAGMGEGVAGASGCRQGTVSV